MKIKTLLTTTLLVITQRTPAQITTDGNLGQAINLSGPDYQIGAELGQQHGPNLFHSFQDFNLSSHESATFSGPNNVQNILSRVTGGNPSKIDGLFRSTIPNANMYFLNPYGIFFGPNARLDVPGSFHASTADYLRLEDGGRFDARHLSDSILTVAPIESFGFLTESPTALSIEGSQLSVFPGQTFSLVGGDISITGGQLLAPSGRFNLASVAQSGEIKLSTLDTSSVEKQGTITFSEQTELGVSGLGAGQVVIRGGQFFSHDSTIQANTLADKKGQGIDLKLTESVNIQGNLVAFSNLTFGSGDAGYMTITVPHLEIIGSILSSSTAGSGSSGSIEIQAKKVILKAGGAIRSESYASGQAGHIDIVATDTLSISGRHQGTITLLGGLVLENYPSDISSDAYSTGQGGQVRITTNQLNLAGGFIGSSSFGEAKAGELVVKANNASLTGGASIASTASHAQGSVAGNITIIIADTLSLSGKRQGILRLDFGENQFEFINTQTTIVVASLGKGQGGQISISVPTLIIDDSAAIAASTLNDGQAGHLTLTVKDLYLTRGGQINNSSGGLMGTQLLIGTGDGGNIQVNATNSITVSGYDEQGTQSGIVSNTLGLGQGGDILIDTHDLTLTNQGTVSANSFGLGDAGNIRIKANNIHLSQGGEIASAAIQAVGGNIEIALSHLLDLQDSQITTSVHGGTGDGGNLTISHPVFLILDKAQITAQADEGHGGDISIVADQLIKSPCSLVNASSRLGVDGNVDIDSPLVNLDDFLVVLPGRDEKINVQLPKGCIIEEILNPKSTFHVRTVREGRLKSPESFME
jgi:filamentous hemagglutinin family protein